MHPCIHASMHLFFTFASENHPTKFCLMKITRTEADAFSITELTSAELNAILTSIEREVHPESEGMSADFMREVHESMCAARERMVQRERIKKNLI